MQYRGEKKSLHPGSNQEIEGTAQMITDAYTGVVTWSESVNAGFNSLLPLGGSLDSMRDKC